MLKGLVLCTIGEKEWLESLLQEGLPCVIVNPMTEENFHKALETLQAEKDEVLCLVESDAQETCVKKEGMKCAGLLSSEDSGEQLSYCEILLETVEETDRQFWEEVYVRAFGYPVQIAETPRLLLRELTMKDIPELVKLYETEEREEFFPEWSEDEEELEERFRSYIKNMYGFYHFGMWAIFEKASGKMIGRAGFGIADYLESSEVDLGYYIADAYRCRGFAKEACEAVLAYGEDRLGLEMCSAYISSENKPSLALIENLKFSKEREVFHKGRLLYRYELYF